MSCQCVRSVLDHKVDGYDSDPSQAGFVATITRPWPANRTLGYGPNAGVPGCEATGASGVADGGAAPLASGTGDDGSGVRAGTDTGADDRKLGDPVRTCVCDWHAASKVSPLIANHSDSLARIAPPTPTADDTTPQTRHALHRPQTSRSGRMSARH